MNDIRLILTSVDKQEAAQEIAQALVSLKLAACVQISAAGTSIYQWQGEICTDEEFYLNIKTDEKHLDAVVTWLKNNHPYDTPEIITLKTKASREYHDWLVKSLKS
ncbi:MAG: divalent-cation tolerance protein CutA [Ghiorsea sp.]